MSAPSVHLTGYRLSHQRHRYANLMSGLKEQERDSFMDKKFEDSVYSLELFKRRCRKIHNGVGERGSQHNLEEHSDYREGSLCHGG